MKILKQIENWIESHIFLFLGLAIVGIVGTSILIGFSNAKNVEHQRVDKAVHKTAGGKVMESGKSSVTEMKSVGGVGVTLSGQAGVYLGTSPTKEDVYRVVLRLNGQYITVQGKDNSLAQRLSYDLQAGDSVQISYVDKEVKNELEHRKWSEIRDVKKVEVPQS